MRSIKRIKKLVFTATQLAILNANIVTHSKD